MDAGQVIAGIVGRGVEEFVVCPGAHNAVLIEALAALEAAGRVRLWSHFEERGAGFFALGRTLAGQPCGVVTTSGTAVAELLPAVIEAHYQRRPLVVLSADRPRRFRGSGAPQAINQAAIFGGFVEGADDIEHGPPDATGGAGVLTHWSGRGPWHVNVCLEESPAPIMAPEPPAAGAEPPRERLDVAPLGQFLRDGIERGLVVAVGDLDPADREPVARFVAALGAPVVAEATSGVRERLRRLALPDPARALRHRPPGKLLRLGGVPSGRFWRDLESMPQTAVCSVSRSGFAGLARAATTLRGAPGQAVAALGPVDRWGDVHGWLDRAGRTAAWIDELLESHPDSEPALVRTLSGYASLGASMFLGNSLALREWNDFAQWRRPVTEVRANRGANGIDGQVSTWLGWSAHHTGAWALAGDLTTLYDMAAPALLGQCIPVGRVLAVIHNHGGRIFDRLPRLRRLSPRARHLLATPQPAQFKHWAATWNLAHLQIRRREEFDLLEEAPRPLVVELSPNPDQTTEFWQAWDAGDAGYRAQ